MVNKNGQAVLVHFKKPARSMKSKNNISKIKTLFRRQQSTLG